MDLSEGLLSLRRYPDEYNDVVYLSKRSLLPPLALGRPHGWSVLGRCVGYRVDYGLEGIDILAKYESFCSQIDDMTETARS